MDKFTNGQITNGQFDQWTICPPPQLKVVDFQSFTEVKEVSFLQVQKKRKVTKRKEISYQVSNTTTQVREIPFPHPHVTHTPTHTPTHTHTHERETKPTNTMNVFEEFSDEIFGSMKLKELVQTAVNSYSNDGKQIDKSIIERFLLYWAEQDSRGKERWMKEKEKKGVFQVKSRIARFLINQNSFQQPKKNEAGTGRLTSSEGINYNEF